ncbi:autotransporter outer membrane beta-barrel domain-containing protein [Termitidicoccus mucosus]|uniref:Autotransporter domain-containing protein n=1 Tax=Termitidicoccus mucosus TaxID=1184151 RepID=A0A178IIY4_9BACT|nr:hypothetical protein AW736_14530 [Opitutaceae bacterium TSB47]
MNPDKTHHAETRPVSEHSQPNTSGLRPQRRLPLPALFVLTALLLTSTGAGLRAQTIINTDTTATGIAVEHTTGGTLTISATVVSTGSYAVRVATSPVTLVNEATGRIEATDATTARRAVDFAISGTLLNAGIISSTAHAGGVGIYAGALITGSNSGLIEGGTYGMDFAAAANGSVFTNSGTILGAGGVSRGIRVNSGASIELANEAGGLITGGQHGVYFNSGGTVTNAGLVTGTASNGEGLTTNGMTKVVNTGIFAGSKYGINFGSTSTNNILDNSGTVSGTGPAGVGVYAQNLLSGTNTGLITGTFGIQFGHANAAGSEIINFGTISGTGANSRGVTSSPAAILLDNRSGGLVEGALQGVYFAAPGGTVTNSGTIKAVATANGRAVHAEGGPLSLTNSGLVQGLQYGVWLNGAAATGSEITNFGTITGTSAGSFGIYSASSSLLVTNSTSGLIEGGTAGVWLAAGGTIRNSGIINATAADGWGVYVADGDALVENLATGTIRGVYAGGTTSVVNDGLITGSGVWLSAWSTLAGSGTISATGTALTLADGANHANAMSLVGTEVGVAFASSGTLVNNARIEGTARHGVQALNASVSVTNAAGALIQGGNSGMYLVYGGTVANSGTISGTHQNTGSGISAEAGPVLVTNSTSGLVQGGAYGLYLYQGGTLVNHGAITSTGSYGYGIQVYGAFTATNTGLIQGSSYGAVFPSTSTLWNSGIISATSVNGGSGVMVGGTSLVTNLGLIEGTAHGLALSNGGTLANSGTIRGDTDGSGYGYGASFSGTFAAANTGLIEGRVGVTAANGIVVLFNSGTIRGAGAGGGIESYGAFTGSNSTSGLIQGGDYGLYLYQGGTVWNAGIVSATLSYNGIGINATGSVVVDNAGGRIEASNDAIQLASGGTIRNSGTIKGGYRGVNMGGNTWGAWVSNTTGGRIEGVAYGVNAVAGGTVWNSGYILGTDTGGADGVYFGGNDGIGEVRNTGTIIGGGRYGVSFFNDTPANLLTNGAGALVQGVSAGVWIEGGTVTNSGAIIGTSAAGYGLWSRGTLSLANDGLIQGGAYGANIILDASGTVTNSGTITGTSAAGIGMNANIRLVTNSASGLIEGGQDGLLLTNSSTLSNSGTIRGLAGAGVGASGRLTGTNTGLIQGGSTGVNLAAGGTLHNSGTITGTAASSYGIYAANASVLISNTTGGLVTGGEDGIYLAAGGTVANSGTLAGGNDSGVYAWGAPVSVTNNAGGAISGGQQGVWLSAAGDVTNNAGARIHGDWYGVYLNAGGSVANTGSITGGYHGVYAIATPAFVDNGTGGHISGSNIGVWLAAGGTVANAGAIAGTGAGGYGVLAENGAALVTNTTSGSITGAAHGVWLGAGGTVFNSGAILGQAFSGRGVYSDGIATVTNAGLIQGVYEGINLYAGGTVANSGIISGTDGSAGDGVYSTNAGTLITVTNNSAGLIEGGWRGIATFGSLDVVNSGTITGMTGPGIYAGERALVTNTTGGLISGGTWAIFLEANAANEVRLWNGSTLAGALEINGDASTLTLAGASGSQSYAAAVTGSTVFTGTLVKTGSGAWDLDSPAASLAGLAQQATLVQAGTLAVDWAAHQLNAAPADVTAGATLQVRKSGTAAATFASPLTGAGYIDLYNAAATAGGEFVLAAAAGNAFTGTIGVRGATRTGYFRLDDNAEAALAGATLLLGANSETTLDADRTIGGLHFDGGRVFIMTDTAASPITPCVLTVGTLAGANGSFGLGDGALTGLDLPRPPGTGALTANIFDVDAIVISDNRTPIVKVTGSSSVGHGTAYSLVDTATAALGESGTMDFYDATGTDIIGKITHGYKAVYYDPAIDPASGASGPGVYLDYGVTAIESTHATTAITLDPTGSHDKTLSAKLAGAGAGFIFTGADTITLAQQAGYTGATLITGSAVLKAGDGIADIIASSTRVTLDGERTGFDLGTANQRVQDFSGSGSVALRDATLTVDNTGFTGTLSGAVTGGAGGLALAGGNLALTGTGSYTGTTAVQTGATLTLGDGTTLGALASASRVSVAAGGTFALWRSDAVTFANTVAADGIIEVKAGSGDTAFTGPLTGSGTLVQNAAALATLSGANDIALLVNRGTAQIGTGGGIGNGWADDRLDRSVTLAAADTKLILDRSDNFYIDTAIAGAGAVDIIGGGTTVVQRQQTYTGATYVRGDTLRSGTTNVFAASAGLTLENAAFDLAGHNQTLQRLHGAPGSAGIPARVYYHTDQIAHIAPDNQPLPASAYATLTTGELTGATEQHLNIDLAGRLSDRLQVGTLATGTHRFVLHRTTTTEIDDAKRTYALDMLALPMAASDDPAVLDITSNEFEMGAHTYRLYRGDGGRIMPETNKFYLSGGDARSRAGDAIYWTAGVAGLDWHYSLDSLRKRMGELRMGGLPENGNVWVTANTYRLNAGGGLAGDGFTQDSFGMTAGGDRRIDLSGDLTLLAGGFLSFARHERDFERHGSGETSGFGLGGYATVLHKDGWYGDFVLRADRNSNKLHSQAVDGFVTDARYGSEAMGASLELGRYVTSGNLWLEPSVQMALARFGSETYDTERQTVYHEPIHVRIDGATAAQYRLQMRGGVDLGRWRPYLRVAEVKSDTGGGKLHVEGREWTPGFDGWRFEAGLGAGYLIDAQSQLYFDYEYNKADAYERPWSLSLGYRRAW